MKYLFIVGRNINLSVEEIKAFLEKEKIPFRIVSIIKNGVLAETPRILKNIVDRLGGTVSIGEVIAEGDSKRIAEILDGKQIYNARKNKLNYAIYNFNGKDFDRISFYLKNRFRLEQLKATEKNLTGRISLQNGGKSSSNFSSPSINRVKEVSKVSSNLIDEQYFVFGNCFGKVIEESDYEAIEKRDMEKPVRRNELSISPRLAKILINLSQVKQGEILLDCFCGIGTILQEALLQGIKVIGIDKDKKAIDCSELNLRWFHFDKINYKLVNADSSLITIPRVNGIATEPQLGELQKRIPKEEEAEKIIKDFEKLMIGVLRNLKGEVQGRIVFTAPLILTKGGRKGCNLSSVAFQCGLKILKGFPIDEFRENSIVGRSVVVLQK